MPPVGICSGPAAPGMIVPVALAVDDEAVVVELELAVARVADRAVLAHLEEAVAVDRHVERVVGRRDVALRELLRDRGDVDADADFVGRAAERVGVDVGELGARRLGADSARVGDVVADDLEALARRVEPGQTLLESHDVCSFRTLN